MGTRTLCFILILQVVFVYSNRPLDRWNELLDDLDLIKKNNAINLDDVYENQLPPPPTQEAGIRYKDAIINDANRVTSEDSTPINRNFLSGSGHLETNEIVKNPNSRKDLILNSKNKKADDKFETHKDSSPESAKSYNDFDIDKAVQNALSNLPSSEESQLVPFIRGYNKRMQEQALEEDMAKAGMDPKRYAKKRFLQKVQLLKLINRALIEKEEGKTRQENHATKDLKVQPKTDLKDQPKKEGVSEVETQNEILKNPNENKAPNTFSTSHNDDSKLETHKEPASVLTKSYSQPDLDKAVEIAVNNLPTSEESPLVPLIKVFNKRIQEKASTEDMNKEHKGSEKLDKEKFLNKVILLKLANKAQKQKEKGKAQIDNQTTQGSQVPEQPKIGQATQAESRNEASEDQPCDCEGGCDEEPSQYQTEPKETEVGCEDVTPEDQTEKKETMVGCEDETPKGQTEPKETSSSEDESRQINNAKLKLLAHIVVVIRKPRSEENTNIIAPPTPISPIANELLRPFRSRDYSPLSHLILQASSHESISQSNIPEPTLDENENIIQAFRERFTAGIATEGCGENNLDDDARQENEPTSFQRMVPSNDEDISSAENQALFQKLANNDQYLNDGHKLPKELILFKHLHEIMKEKAAANAFKNTPESRKPQFFASSSSREPISSPSPLSRMIIIRSRNQLPQPQLPPLYFPKENSGYKVIHLSSSRHLPNSREGDDDLNLDDESRDNAQPLTSVREEEQNDVSPLRPSNSGPQDIPWFIKNIIANLSRTAGENRLQPIPSQFTPLKNADEEEKPPVLFRALLAPYAV